MTRLQLRWRTQQSAIIKMNCRFLWIIEILNALRPGGNVRAHSSEWQFFIWFFFFTNSNRIPKVLESNPFRSTQEGKFFRYYSVIRKNISFLNGTKWSISFLRYSDNFRNKKNFPERLPSRKWFGPSQKTLGRSLKVWQKSDHYPIRPEPKTCLRQKSDDTVGLWPTIWIYFVFQINFLDYPEQLCDFAVHPSRANGILVSPVHPLGNVFKNLAKFE